MSDLLVETELKFQVPPTARARIARALATATSQVTRLQAVYADSADDRLARAGLALRLRKEGRVWVQTLKGRGDGLMRRLEHEVRLPAQRGIPVLERQRHAGTAAGIALAEALGDAELMPLYSTDIRRTHRRVRCAGALVEIALDEGRIIAGARDQQVCEIEFELLEGTPSALLALAARWAQRHGLWLDLRSKSERGHRLARGLDGAAATRAGAIRLPDHPTTGNAFFGMVESSLAHGLRNLAELAGAAGGPEHLHQLRVALRRLRTALRLFGDWSADVDRAAALEQQLRAWFVRLGEGRDDDVLAQTLAPVLAAPRAPALALPRLQPAEDLSVMLRDAGFTVLLLHAWELACRSAGLPAGERPLADAARERLEAARRAALKNHRSFTKLPPPQQHRMRKRLKRLRYGAEFLAALFSNRSARRALDALRSALEALGTWNDYQVAEQRLRALIADDPKAWFVLGWVAAGRGDRLRRCEKALRRFKAAPRLAN